MPYPVRVTSHHSSRLIDAAAAAERPFADGPWSVQQSETKVERSSVLGTATSMSGLRLCVLVLVALRFVPPSGSAVPMNRFDSDMAPKIDDILHIITHTHSYGYNKTIIMIMGAWVQ